MRIGIERHAERLSDLFRQLDENADVDTVNIVAHSMGSIITRTSLQQYTFKKLSRIVLLAPPLAGSPVATRVSPALKWFCPPLEELSDRPNSLVNSRATDFPCETGVIAAARDRVIPETNTQSNGLTDHIVVPGGHTTILVRRTATEQVVNFLRHGEFTR